MQFYRVFKDATSQIFDVFLQNTFGDALTGLVFNTAGLSASYHRENAPSPVTVPLVTMTVGSYTSGGFKEIDPTVMPGWYQLCVPNLAFASGPGRVAVQIRAVGMPSGGENLLVSLEDNIAALLAAGVSISALGADAITAASLAPSAGVELANALLDLADGVETGETFRQYLRLSRASLYGLLSGVNTNTPTFRDKANTKNRITSTTAPTGRTSIVLDPT